MAILSELVESVERPSSSKSASTVGNSGAEAAKNSPHDPVLNSLLTEHKHEPLEFVKTVIDFLGRKSDFFAKEVNELSSLLSTVGAGTNIYFLCFSISLFTLITSHVATD